MIRYNLKFADYNSELSIFKPCFTITNRFASFFNAKVHTFSIFEQINIRNNIVSISNKKSSSIQEDLECCYFLFLFFCCTRFNLIIDTVNIFAYNADAFWFHISIFTHTCTSRNCFPDNNIFFQSKQRVSLTTDRSIC